MKKEMNIRVVVDGLTVGSRVYKAGDILQAEHVTEDFRRYASGELRFYDGRRVLEFTTEAGPEPEPTEGAEPVPPSAPPDTSVETIGPNTETETAVTNLADLILEQVREGKGKHAISREIGGQSEEYTIRGVLAEFDALVESGRIVEGEKPGSYSVKE